MGVLHIYKKILLNKKIYYTNTLIYIKKEKKKHKHY